jgi:hypothetical protein
MTYGHLYHLRYTARHSLCTFILYSVGEFYIIETQKYEALVQHGNLRRANNEQEEKGDVSE